MFPEWNSDRKPQKKGEVAWDFPELLALGIRGSNKDVGSRRGSRSGTLSRCTEEVKVNSKTVAS
jgi:hypothetical protein